MSDGRRTMSAGTIPSLLSARRSAAVMQSGVNEREERYLARRFGQEYLAYRARVRRRF